MVAASANEPAPRPVAFRGFKEDLEHAQSEVARLATRLSRQPCDLQGRVRLLYRMFHRASLSGRMTYFEEMDAELRNVLRDFGPKEDICLLKVNLDFRFHRLHEVRRDMEMAPMLASRVEGKVLLADLDMQEGRYRDAQLALESLIAKSPTWDILARLAHWKGKLGEFSEADGLYREAEDELTAKQMLSYAWLEVQRGLLAFNSGNYADAWSHYHRADSSYPGHWYTAEHMAELLAAEERFDEALVMLREVVERTDKPELCHALAEMYVCAGRQDIAETWFNRALTAYQESARRGDVHYFHHLADYYGGAMEEPAEALVWARRDIELRSNFSTQTALAWALYRNGKLAESMDFIRLALTSGVRDAVILSTAAELFEASGDMAASRQYTAAALKLNPLHRRFRMHH